MSIVRAEECRVLTVLLDPVLGVLEDVLLCTCDTDVACRIRSGDVDEGHAEILTGLHHDGPAASHGLHGQVAGEGDVDEGVASKLMGGVDHEVAAGDEVVVADQVGGGGDDTRILVGLTCDADDVGPDFLDPPESLGRARNGLVDDDGLHQGVVGKAGDDGDRGLLLLHEVVRIGQVLDHATLVDGTVLGDEGLGTPEVVLALGDRTGDDTDVGLLGDIRRGAGGCISSGGLRGDRRRCDRDCLGLAGSACEGEGTGDQQSKQDQSKFSHRTSNWCFMV